MSYHIYTTRGLILSSRPFKEADRLYSILTENLGLIYARALGARKEGSKLRGQLEPFSLSSVSLIKGKNQWRLTSASLLEATSGIQKNKKKTYKALARGFSLLEKLVQGEEKHRELFEAIRDIFIFAKTEDRTEEMFEALEVVLVARMLYYLGYLREEEGTHELVSAPLTKEFLEKVESTKKPLIKLINEGIEASNLTQR
jgi:DNA repair protein RecO